MRKFVHLWAYEKFRELNFLPYGRKAKPAETKRHYRTYGAAWLLVQELPLVNDIPLACCLIALCLSSLICKTRLIIVPIVCVSCYYMYYICVLHVFNIKHIIYIYCLEQEPHSKYF